MTPIQQLALEVAKKSLKQAEKSFFQLELPNTCVTGSSANNHLHQIQRALNAINALLECQ